MTSERETWLKWRQQGVGSSDAPVIMKVSPWKTLRQLYEEKISTEIKEEEENFAMQKGNEMEPRARNHFAALYSIENGVDESFEARLVTMAGMPFLRASLDGSSKDGKKIIEIKYQGKDVHQAVIDHKLVPEKYYPQIQHALMVSGAEICYFVSINDSYDVRWIEVTPSIPYIKEMLRAETAFWAHVVNRVPPALSDGDYKSLRYKGASEDIRAYLAGSTEAETRILDEALKTGHKYLKAKGIKITDGKINA